MKLNFSAEEFKLNFFQKKPKHITKAFQAGLFSWADLDELLYVFDVSEKSVRLVNEKLLPESDFAETSYHYGLTRKTFNKKKIYQELESGASLILNRVEQKSLRIKRLCNALSHIANGQVVANGYLAKTGDSAFGNHWDSHDVFASQLLGNKRWLIYPPTFIDPIVGQKSIKHLEDCPTEAYMDVITEPGDILYIPRGWWHCAFPSEGPCFHVAVGVHKPYIIDYLGWVSANILSRDKMFRQTLDLDGQNPISSSMLSDIAESLMDLDNFKAFENQIYKKENIDNGMHLSIYYGLSTDQYANYYVKLASPFTVMVERANINIAGIPINQHPIGKYLSFEEQSIASLRSKAEVLTEEQFFSSIKTLIASGYVFIHN
ncbi:MULTISPECIES: cupin domain-containing protein [Pseudomonas syringae group]|uniref:Cupin 4 family protein n=1 Tax=Pseudomonas syringae pv. ribicola TaxID=55398 RepID=A0A0Q0BHT5_PSESI|nr:MULTISPECIES: cupin domain-containing protein [Pseudomonas syringae group]EKN46105.1 cupin 4 family protein [Pseudomonas viridiflava UASWS0038]KPY46178.1 Cupin 4 family protein [Pseudomonas syringae pv. ribicola]KPZ26207.1 Cupin 4 family protein [Pseudomonas viridiflava]MEE3917285.1 cupin domain-containing protein [Pseudomonas viridiflava]MEE3976021.1 cupin domain-containing protein [Pseudomonas viridiflava]